MQSILWNLSKDHVLCLALVFCCASALGESINGKVVGVKDGDTIVVLNQNRPVVIRVVGIDAPEKKQAYGRRAKEAMSDCAYGREAVIEWHKLDRYGRTIGKVLVGGTDCGLELIEKGLAWHYKVYSKEQVPIDRQAYAASELRARDARMGLWSDPSPEPPWVYRHISK